MASQRQCSPIRDIYADLGSPDPLAESPLEEASATPISPKQGAGRARSQIQMKATHHRKSSEIEITPSKLVTEQNLSPWKITVTVEANPDNAADSNGTEGTQTITRTMKVPLRDASSPTKKVSNGMTGHERRSASPARRTRSRRQSVTDLDLVVLGDDAEEDEWSSKPRSPRKRRSSKSQVAKKPVSASRKTGPAASTFEIQADEGTSTGGLKDIAIHGNDQSPEMREISLNKVALRARSNSTRTDDHLTKKDLRKVSVNSALSYPTPSPTASERDDSDDRRYHAADENPSVGLDTVMESEGFTMIDLDSLPSVRHMKNTPDYPTIPEKSPEHTENALNDTTGELLDITTGAPSISVTNDHSNVSSDLASSPPDIATGKKSKAYRIGHLQLPSSTTIQRHRLVTPMPVNSNPHSSPVLPSPPRAPVSAIKERSPIHSGEAVEAGSALQDAVTPDQSLISEHEEQRNIQDKPEKALFGGFSSETRRELRAELRFGEELAKKQALNDVAAVQPHVWRNEAIVQHTPPVVTSQTKDYAHMAEKISNGCNETAVAEGNARLEQEQQADRGQVVQQAKSSTAIVIEDDDASDVDADETMGDIWLAEARQTSSSPRESLRVEPAMKEVTPDLPRRKLIPSPWKRGQHIDFSQISADESFSGILWKKPSSDTNDPVFGEVPIARPATATRSVFSSERRRSGTYDAENMIIRTPCRISERHDSDEDEDDQDISDENFDDARRQLRWRSAQEVIEEETDMLEGNNDQQDHEYHDGQRHDVGTTRLYETNLDDVPEQDLSSSPQVQTSKLEHHNQQQDHDSTYSSISDESSAEAYRLRTSLSPSKERPKTPRSALKGGRASFGMALKFGNDSDDADARKVVWAKRSTCMNEAWEESTTSIRSQRTADEGNTSLPAYNPTKQGLNLEPSFEVQPQAPIQQHQGSKGWFGWFSKETAHAETQVPAAQPRNSWQPRGLDGSIDEFIKFDDEEEHSTSSFVPTSRHHSAEIPTLDLRSRGQHEKLPVSNNDGHLSRKSSSPPPAAVQPQLNGSMTVPSYLRPPSYPSDQLRDPSVPLSISGPFTNTHFRTLHIIHRKSQRAKFHAPAFPEDIRPKILDLVSKWHLEVDETATMGEDGFFDFSIGSTEARVLERFMREVEHGYHERGVMDVAWEWDVEELAGRLGRIAVGESVREEEREAQRILGGVK